MTHPDAMKPAEDLALRFASLVAQERDIEARLTKIRAEKEEALRRLLTFKPNGNGGTSADGGGKERVFQLLESQSTRIYGTAEVAKELGIAANVASAYLSELYNKDRRIARVAKGRYQALQASARPSERRAEPEGESLKTK